MKTRKNKAQGLYHYKTNDRWKWMAGATAASAAAASASQATTMTITLTGNNISFDGNNLNANLFGHGNIFSFSRTTIRGNSNAGTVSAHIKTFHMNGGGGYGRASVDEGFAFAKVFSAMHSTHKSTTSYGKVSRTQPIQITFSDPSVNGGALTDGSLYVTASALSGGDPGPGYAIVSLDKFTYNKTSSVPDQGSTLALLALGAGGVIALRQLRKAEAKS